MPRGIRKSVISTNDVQVRAASLTIPESGPAQILDRGDIEIIQPRNMLAKAAEEAFMQEFVVINIESTGDPDEPEFISCGHNGIPQWIRRGTDQRIRRKFLYSLIAGKKKNYMCSFGQDASGSPFNHLNPRSGTVNRLVIIDDTRAGRDRFVEWMKEG